MILDVAFRLQREKGYDQVVLKSISERDWVFRSTDLQLFQQYGRT